MKDAHGQYMHLPIYYTSPAIVPDKRLRSQSVMELGVRRRTTRARSVFLLLRMRKQCAGLPGEKKIQLRKREVERRRKDEFRAKLSGNGNDGVRTSLGQKLSWEYF